MDYTQAGLAELVGYSVRRLQQIDKSLSPNEKLFIAGKSGKYDGRAFVENWVKYQIKQALPEESKLDLEQVRARHELLKMEKTNLAIRREKGELVETSDVKLLWSEIITAFRNGLLQIGSALSPRLAQMQDVKEIKGLIDQSIGARLREIVECQLPSNKEVTEEDEEE